MPRTTALIGEGIREGQQLGAQLYVSMRGKVMADLAAGESRAGVPMTPETVNLWFSCGKPLTAIAVARLYEAGRVDLEAPVAGYIPEFAAGGKEAIRVRHLLNHTAGFRSADRVTDTLPWNQTIQAICAVAMDPGWIPGERAGYQLFSSWFILGEIVQRVEGRRIERFVAEEILQPLGMNDCWMGLPPERFQAYGDRLGLMHFVTQGDLRPHPTWNSQATAALVRPGGNVRGPIRELAKLYEALLGLLRPEARQANSQRALLRSSTVAEVTARDRVGMFDETFRHTMDWGLGFAVNSNRYGIETVPYGFGRFASDPAFGHGGSQSSCGFADPEHGLVVAWVCNGMIGETAHQKRAREINSAIYEDLGLR